MDEVFKIIIVIKHKLYNLLSFVKYSNFTIGRAGKANSRDLIIIESVKILVKLK